MANPRVLITARYLRPGDQVDRLLLEAGIQPVYNPWHGGRTEEEMIDVLREIDGAIVSIDPFTPRVLEAAKKLRVVARTGVGYDGIDVGAATARGIAVCISRGTNHRTVADYAMALLLQCARKMVENLTEIRKGGWSRFQGHELAGRTLGIIGFGLIGKEVAKRARGFDMRVLAYDTVRDEGFASAHQVSFVALEWLLRESDYVTLHTPLNAETRHMINAERLALMKPTAYLINTARGGIVDSQALAQALREKRIAGAALDVFHPEPLPADSPLRELENAYISPHAAGQTVEAITAMGVMAAENVIAVLRGDPPPCIVNPEVLK